jgi:hypothetical protein
LKAAWCNVMKAAIANPTKVDIHVSPKERERGCVCSLMWCFVTHQ